MSAVGFVGLGAMGGPIAGRLLAAGHDEHVPLPSAAAAHDVLATASELGYDGRDIAALREVLARLAGAAALPRPTT